MTEERIMENELIIESKNRKSLALVIILSILTFQLTFVIIQIISKFNEISLFQTLFTLGLCAGLLYLVVRGLIWQLKGVRKLEISNNSLTYTKYAPLTNWSKTFNLDKVKGVSIEDTTVKEGPLAMLQLLGIADKLFLTVDYEGKTIKTISGNSLNDLQDVRDKISAGLG